MPIEARGVKIDYSLADMQSQQSKDARYIEFVGKDNSRSQIIKYQYAIDSNDKTINVENLYASAEIRKEVFRCLSCNNILIPVLGEKRRKHFRHKLDVQLNCSPETYLHKLAKLKFYEVYNNCLKHNEPFWIELEISQICNYYQADFLQSCNFHQGKWMLCLKVHIVYQAVTMFLYIICKLCYSYILSFFQYPKCNFNMSMPQFGFDLC